MPRELLPKAKAALERALELDPTLAEAHALLGYIEACFEYDWVGGEHELKYALTLDPHSPNCLYRYAFSIRGLGHRLDEALALARRAQDNEPRSVLFNPLPPLLPLSSEAVRQVSRGMSPRYRVRASPIMAELAVNPLVEPFRSDPRYKMVLKRMNLPFDY